MRRLLVAVAVLVSGAPAQVIPIDSVRKFSLPNGVPVDSGQVVSITGVVSAASEFGPTGPAFVQDNTGGVALYGAEVGSLAIGDSIIVTGTVTFYNGLTELQGLTIVPVSSGNWVRPWDVSVLHLGDTLNDREVNEGKLGVIRRVIFDTVPGLVFEAGKTYPLKDSSGRRKVCYIDPQVASIIGQPVPEDTIDLLGCVSQYDYTPPYFAFYQVTPRFSADLVPGAIAETPTRRWQNSKTVPATIILQGRVLSTGRVSSHYLVLDCTGRVHATGVTTAQGQATLNTCRAGVYMLRISPGMSLKVLVLE